MNRATLYLAVALILGTAAYVKFCAIPNAIAAAQSDARADSLGKAKARADSVEDLRRADSVRWAKTDTTLSRANVGRTVFIHQNDSASAKRADSLQAVLATVPDSVRSLVNRSLAGVTASRDTLAAIVRADSTIILGLRSQLASANSAVHDLTALIAATRNALDLERKRHGAGCGLTGNAGVTALTTGQVGLGGTLGFGCHL